MKVSHLDVVDALARDAELGCELLERDRIIRQPPRLNNAPLLVIEQP